MISSATRGAGGRALGAHLANPEHNERVEVQQSRGLLSESIREQIDELTGLASHARTRRPLYHVHLDPPADHPLNPQERARYWEKFESEFGLSDRPFSSVIHEKHGREHEHRVYLAVKSDGRAVKFDHDYARREKLNRVFELERGEALTVGRHNRAVANALEREGRDDLAQQIQESGITDAPRPQAISPNERHQQERTGILKIDVAQQVLTAWQQSDNGQSFANALNENGLTLAHGQKCAVVIDGTGNTHALGRLLNFATKEVGIDRIPTPAVVERISTAEIPTVSTYQEYRVQQTTTAPENPQPIKGDSEVSASPRGGSLETANVTQAGGRQAPEPEATQQDNAPLLADVVDGPGEPPGKNASFEEKARYRKRLYEYDRLKGLLWFAIQRANSNQKPKITTPTGGNIEPTQQQKLANTEASARIARLFSNPRFERPQPSDSWTAIRTEISRDISEARQARTLGEFVQRDRVGGELREIAPTASPANRAEPSGNEHDSATSRTDTSTNRNIDSNRKRLNAIKFENCKIENTLAKILTPEKRNLIDRMVSALSKPMTFEQIAERNTQKAQKEIDTVLSTRPKITAKDLSRDFQREKIVSELYDRIAERKPELQKEQKNAHLAESKVSAFERFIAPVFKTESVIEAEKAQEKLEDLTTKIEQENHTDRQKIANAGEMAKYVSDENRKILWKWEKRAEVVTAKMANELLAGAKATASQGSDPMKRLLAENKIKEAFELQRKIQEAQKEMALKDQMTQSAAAAAPPAPRIR